VSAPTYHRWRQLNGGMNATEAKRLQEWHCRGGPPAGRALRPPPSAAL
jgi:hypothetical protein